MLYLCDAMALAYRAHFAFIQRPLINKKGQDTSAIYGFTNSLIKLLEDEQPDHIAVVFDAPGKTFRDEVYEQYKAHRPPMPDGIREGIPYIKKIVEALDIPVLEVDGVEADDVIGTLAKKAEAEGVDVVIVSPDKDFRQLISEQVSMLRPAYKGEGFNPETLESFRDKYGVEPIQFIDILALMGDAADNVPGVPGIGEKTALSLLQEHGSVEKLLEVGPTLKAKRAREGLTNHADDARMSKELVTIMIDVPVNVDWHTLHRTPPNMPAVHKLFDELEFGNRLRDRVVKYASGEGVSVEEAAGARNGRRAWRRWHDGHGERRVLHCIGKERSHESRKAYRRPAGVLLRYRDDFEGPDGRRRSWAWRSLATKARLPISQRPCQTARRPTRS